MKKVVKDVITALIIVPTLVLIDDRDRFNKFKASLYIHMISKGNIIITGAINKKIE